MNTFEVKSGKLILSDPSYEYPTWCQGVVKAKNGKWDTRIIESKGRVATIAAFNIESAMSIPKLMDKLSKAPAIPFIGGVDSGQFGYFDFNTYRDDASVNGLPIYSWGNEYDTNEVGDIFYRACCDITINDTHGVLPNGFVSTSGYGDGSYTTFGLADENGEYYALITHFIFSDEEDMYEDEDEDESLDEESEL